MSNENLVPPNVPSVAEMLRITGGNTAQFMDQVALHIEKLESEIMRLTAMIQDMSSQNNESK